MDEKYHADSELIERLGGAAKLAQLLGYTEPTRTQRVQNWKYRGIPEVVKLRRPDLFLLPEAIEQGQSAKDEAA